MASSHTPAGAYQNETQRSVKQITGQLITHKDGLKSQTRTIRDLLAGMVA
jgi:hypothetical protein